MHTSSRDLGSDDNKQKNALDTMLSHKAFTAKKMSKNNGSNLSQRIYKC